jgi:putative endopeptidase
MDRRNFLNAGASALITALAACATPKAQAPVAEATPLKPLTPLTPIRPKADIGAFGLDLDARDLGVKPGDDFFRHVNGSWLKTATIPGDRSSWGVFDMLAEGAEKNVKAIIEEIAAKTAAPGTIEQKIGDFYRAFLDTDTIERTGLAALKPDLDRIAAARTHIDIATLIAAPDLPVNGPIGWNVTLDDGNPDRYLMAVSHSGLGLPDREYYSKADARMSDIRAKYKLFIAQILNLSGQSDAEAKAAKIMALETEIAKRHWKLEDRRDSTKMYNLKSRADIKKLAPAYPWEEALKASGLVGMNEAIVNEITAMKPLADLFRATPVATWRAYLAFHLVTNRAAITTKAIDDAHFDFYGKTLNGRTQQRERWKRAGSALNGALGEAIGQVYVQRHFSPAAKTEMVTLVENLRKAFAVRIQGLTWMSAETKKAAMEKLATFRPKIGYPDKWRDYAELEIRPGDAYGNAKRATVAEWNRDIARLGKTTDKDEWFMTPQTVNAYYNPVFNEIVFPAAILQAPFFDIKADKAINYGAIGGVIGHEMGHGFDDQGAKYDAKGVLRDWWAKSDVDAFTALGKTMVAQYSKFETLPGVKVNGQLTLGENIGDHCGLVVGHEAYKIALAGQTPEVLDGLTGDQRFFMSWAQVWRDLARDEDKRNQVESDPHSPAEFRVNGAVQNIDAWYQSFAVEAGDKLYLAPEARTRIW